MNNKQTLINTQSHLIEAQNHLFEANYLQQGLSNAHETSEILDDMIDELNKLINPHLFTQD